jgi:hypothetical protein
MLVKVRRCWVGSLANAVRELHRPAGPAPAASSRRRQRCSEVSSTLNAIKQTIGPEARIAARPFQQPY